MTCHYASGVLRGESPWTDVSAHLAGCAECRALAAELDRIDADFRALAPPPLPPGLLDGTRERLFDEAFRDLAAPPVPPALAERTRAAMDQLAAPEPRRRRWPVVLGGALAAAAALVLVVSPPPPADPGTLVEKGAGVSLPDVALKVAVERGGSTARHDPRQAYESGATLFFRAATSAVSSTTGPQPYTLSLVRIHAGGADVIHQQPAAAGEADLSLGGAPLGWRIEPGEGDAVFALLAAPAILPEARIEAALAGAADPCRAAAALPASCAAVPVDVLP